jgi:hypothetical protein
MSLIMSRRRFFALAAAPASVKATSLMPLSAPKPFSFSIGAETDAFIRGYIMAPWVGWLSVKQVRAMEDLPPLDLSALEPRR